MRHIAEAVGVSKAALYYYFKDKEELFIALLELYLEQLGEEIEQFVSVGQNFEERIRLLVHTIIAKPFAQRAVIRLAKQEMAHLSAPAQQYLQRVYQQKFFIKIQAIIQEAQARGELRTIDPEIATWILLGMMYPYLYPSSSEGAPDPLEVQENILTIFLEGISKQGS